MKVEIGKSIIQLIREEQTKVDALKSYVKDFFEKYDTHNMVFGLNCGNACELVEGYLEVEKEFDSLNEALSNLQNSKMAVQVMERDDKKVYRVGNVYKQHNDCKFDKMSIVDIKKLVDLV